MEVTMYTDGAARGNPDGPGGYGVVLHYIDKSGTLHEKELSAGYKKTTNNLHGAVSGHPRLRGIEQTVSGYSLFRFEICSRCI